MEVMGMHETYYMPEQLAQLEARREKVGEDEIAAIEREWAELSTTITGFTRGDPRHHREPRPHV
jgi:hypothetical protein